MKVRQKGVANRDKHHGGHPNMIDQARELNGRNHSHIFERCRDGCCPKTSVVSAII